MSNESLDPIELFGAFQDEWNVERMKNLSLEQYTNGDKKSFTYQIEFKMTLLGSIKGGSSFKFGIFKRKDKKNVENENGKKHNDKYSWYAKYGDTQKDAFTEVKKRINEIIKYAGKNDLKEIDKLDFGNACKWKIAFQYQNNNNIQTIPVYKEAVLKSFLKNKGLLKSKMTMSDMYSVIKTHYNILTLQDAMRAGDEVLDEYDIFNPRKEGDKINNYKDYSKNKKGNATTNLDEIVYLTKAHKVKYAIRGAVGQLLEYSYYNKKRFDYKIIIIQSKPNKKSLNFLNYLKENHNIYYLYEKSINKFTGNIFCLLKNTQ